jgi:hypothetical protein
MISHNGYNTAGNIATCSFTVQVLLPLFNVVFPSDLRVSTDASRASALLPIIYPAFSNQSRACVVTNISVRLQSAQDFTGAPSTVSFVDFPVGISTIVFSLFNPYTQQRAQGQQIIEVYDSESPRVEGCPTSVTVSTDHAQSFASYSWLTPNVTDNSGGPVTESSTFTARLREFQLGTTEVVYLYEDMYGNIANCTFSVTVLDTEPPVITNDIGDSVVVLTDAGSRFGTYVWSPLASDNVAVIDITTNAMNMYPIGVTTVTTVALDAAGNSVAYRFNVTVIDVEAPVATGACPSSFSVSTIVNRSVATPLWSLPNFTDNSNMPVTVLTQLLSGAPAASGMTLSVGVYTVTVTASDEAGNSLSCRFNVTVQDKESPVFGFCPANINILTNNCSGRALVTWNRITAVDNLGAGGISFALSIHPAAQIGMLGLTGGGYFPLGTTNVTIRATDLALNFAYCSFLVTVRDPVFSLVCPPSLQLSTDPGLPTRSLRWTPPTIDSSFAACVTVNTSTAYAASQATLAPGTWPVYTSLQLILKMLLF